jgi:hypothetical protein
MTRVILSFTERYFGIEPTRLAWMLAAPALPISENCSFPYSDCCGAPLPGFAISRRSAKPAPAPKFWPVR